MSADVDWHTKYLELEQEFHSFRESSQELERALEAELEQAYAETNKLKTQSMSLNESLNRQRSQSVILASRSDLESAALQEAVKELRKSNDTLKTRCRSLEQEHDDMERKMRILEAGNSQLKHELEIAHENAILAQNELEDERTKLQEQVRHLKVAMMEAEHSTHQPSNSHRRKDSQDSLRNEENDYPKETEEESPTSPRFHEQLENLKVAITQMEHITAKSDTKSPLDSARSHHHHHSFFVDRGTQTGEATESENGDVSTNVSHVVEKGGPSEQLPAPSAAAAEVNGGLTASTSGNSDTQRAAADSVDSAAVDLEVKVDPHVASVPSDLKQQDTSMIIRQQIRLLRSASSANDMAATAAAAATAPFFVDLELSQSSSGKGIRWRTALDPENPDIRVFLRSLVKDVNAFVSNAFSWHSVNVDQYPFYLAVRTLEEGDAGSYMLINPTKPAVVSAALEGHKLWLFPKVMDKKILGLFKYKSKHRFPWRSKMA